MMSKTTKICPVCGSENTGNKTYCSVCSWSFPEDCTQNRVLFTEEQLKQYEERVSILQKLVKDGGSAAKAHMQKLEDNLKKLQKSEAEWQRKHWELKQALEKAQTAERELTQKLNKAQETERELRQNLGKTGPEEQELRRKNAELVQENQRNRKELVEARKNELANRDLKAVKERLEKSDRELRATVTRLENTNRDLRAANSRLEDENRQLRMRNTASVGTQGTSTQLKKPDPIQVQVPKKTTVSSSVPKSVFDDVNTRLGRNGKLMDYSIDEICRRIENGSFEGLYVGDHFYINGHEYLFAGFDCLPDGYRAADGKFRNHFAVIIPGECLDTAKMYVSRLDNQYHDVPGDAAYHNSHIYKNVLPKLANRLQKDFHNHILHKDGQIELELMSRNMLNGKENANGKLPIFTMWPHTTSVTSKLFGSKGRWYWLRDQVDRDRFAACDPYGIVSDLAETANDVGVRPYFCIG